MVISAVLFDFDGTLTQPHAIDFAAIRQDLGCPEGQPILEFMDDVPDGEARARAEAILFRHEMASAEKAQPNEGAEQVVRELADMGLPLAILTRNIRSAVDRSLDSFTTVSAGDFAVIVTRDDGVRPKPDPEGNLHIASTLGISPAELLCVGDYIFDVQAAQKAGCPCAFITNGDEQLSEEHDADFEIRDLHEIISIVSMHLRPGKGKRRSDWLADPHGEEGEA